MMILQIILEEQDDQIWGRIETSDFLYTTSASTVESVTSNLRELVENYLLNEGKNKGVSINNISFQYITLFNPFHS